MGPAAIAVVVLALLSALPVLFAVHPVQDDFPAHLARYHIMLEHGQGGFLDRYYEFAWVLRGNLGVDLLMVPMGGLLGAPTAAWLIAALLPPLTGLAIVTVEWTLRRRIGPASLLAMTTIWSPAMSMGFANFALSLALALFAFALWVRLERWRWRAALLVPVGLLVWLCHSAGWGVLGVMVFGYEWSRSKSWRSLLAPWPLFFPALAILAEPGIGGSIDYGGNVATYKLAIWLKGLADTEPALDVVSVVALVAAIVWAWCRGRLDPRLGWAALIVALLTLAMPRFFGGGDLADQRLVPVALLLGCLAIDVRVSSRLLVLAGLLFLVRLGATSLAWHEQSARLEAALAGMQYLPHGARVAGATPFYTGRWAGDAWSHAPSYATVYRDALVNTHFALPGVHMLKVKQGGADFVDPSQRIETKPGEAIDLSQFAPAKRADYLWYFGDNPVEALPGGAIVLHRTGFSLLVRLAKPGDPR